MAYVPAVPYVTITALLRVSAERVQSNTSNFPLLELSHPISNSSPFSPFAHWCWVEISTVVPKDSINRRGMQQCCVQNKKKKSAPKNICSRTKCQAVLKEAVPLCLQDAQIWSTVADSYSSPFHDGCCRVACARVALGIKITSAMSMICLGKEHLRYTSVDVLIIAATSSIVWECRASN